MTIISFSEVEEWLDANPSSTYDYFLRKAELDLVNKWLVAHGFLSIHDYVSSRRGSCSLGTSGNNSPNSPIEKNSDSCYFNDNDMLTPTHHRRTNSKKYLRHDFAKAKSKSVFRTCEPLSTCNADTHSRRSSLKGLRKYSSLPPNSINILSLLIESKIRLPKYACKGRDSKVDLRYRNEREFLLDIVKDIANDLDLKSLTHKIITNLSILLDADGASLFIVEGPKGKQCLVSKVFDVHCGTNMLPTMGGDNMIQVPWGKGILGYVADTGDVVNLADSSTDSRYNDEVDRIIGYHTDSLLCMPVRNAYDEIIAVAQVINKNPRIGSGEFTKDDEKLFETYLQFVGIAITNAQIFEMSRREYDRNRTLLEVAHDLFEEQTSLDTVVLKIMQRAQKLLKCERSAVLLLQENSEEVKFVKTFHLTSQSDLDGVSSVESSEKRPETRMTTAVLRMAEQVASTGEVLNIAETLEVEKGSLGNVRSLLSMPIRNGDFKVIGVAQIINKLDGHPFDETDEQLFEAFTIFCGLGINNTMIYNELEKAMAKQKVTLEVLSYHATACVNDVERLMGCEIYESEKWNLCSLSFNDFSLTDDEMVLASVRMFIDLNLLNRFKIRMETLLRWLVTVRKNYRAIPYHNWRHAFNVAQVMFTILKDSQTSETFSDLEFLAMFVGSLCHDLDHRGTNNSFQAKTGSALALLYGNKNTMEHHHFNHAVMILSHDSNNIFSSVSSESYSKVMNFLKHAILSTDLSTYFQIRSKFFALVDNFEYDWNDDGHREMFRSMLMTACDLAASTKPWPVQQQVAELVTREFFDQGDKEKLELNIQPQALMDRERKHELPLLQISWIRDICLPLYKSLTKVNSRFECMARGAMTNIEQWAELAGHPIENFREETTDFVIKETGV
ncbi:hypothetical protein CHUAL_010366 [Chamberlinius hualienensis]